MNGLAISLWDVAIILGYFALTIAFGVWAGRAKIRTAEQLFLADREASWPLVGASLFSANISSQQFVGQAGLAFSIGLAAGAFQLVGAMCFIFLAAFFVDVYLGLKLTTAPEFFERRYGPGTRLFVAAINVVMILAANLTAALYAGATVLTDLVGWNSAGQFMLAAVSIAAGAGLCAIFGGLRSVLWFDLMQATVLVFGGLLTLCCTLMKAGGWSVLRGLHDAQGVNLWSVIQPWTHPFGWLSMATGAVILGVHGHCTDHDYVQRALAAKSLFHSKLGALFASFLKIVALFIIAAPGVVAVKLLPSDTPPDRVYAQLVTEFIPAGFIGLVLAGLLAAILGSMASGLSAISSMLTFDFVIKLAPALSDRRRVQAGRLIMFVVLVVCVLCAPLIGRYQGLYAYLVKTWSLLAPPVFVCVVAGVFTRRATNAGAIATLVTGAVLGLAAFVALDRPEIVSQMPVYLRAPLNIGFVITLVCTGVMWLVSRRNASSDPSAGGFATWQEETSLEAPMTSRERRIYRLALLGVALLLGGVTVALSPWGLAPPAPGTAVDSAAAQQIVSDPAH